MFEEELAMEKRSSNILPMLLMLLLLVVIVGSVGYWIVQSRQVLTQQQATTIVTDILKAQGPSTVKFYTGPLQPSFDEKPSDPHYKLLEKGGYLTLAKQKKGNTVNVALTAKAEQELAGFPEFQKRKMSDGTEQLTVPLAQRRLVGVSRVTMNGPRIALVEYAWKWDTTTVGELFDASGPAMKGFNIWESQRLIERYGANFFHGSPAKVTVKLAKDDKGVWSVSRD